MSDYPYTSEKGYALRELYIVSSNGNITSIFNLMLEISLFEDIYNASMSGYVLINDSLDLFATIPLTGFEFLKISLEKPGSESDVIMEKVFRIYKMTGGAINESTTSNQTYMIHFCSEENIISESRRISKSYRGKTTSEIIKDILTNQLNVSKNKLIASNIENTSGIHDIIIPYMNPLQATSWVSSRAISTNSKSRGALFMFYENTQGYNFKSIETLFQKPTKAKYVFQPKNVEPSREETTVDDMRRAIKYEFMKVFDVIDAINSGMFSGVLKSVDLTKLQVNDFVLDYKDMFSKTTHIESQNGSFDFQNEYEDRLKNKIYQNYFSFMRMYPSNRGHDTDPVISKKQPSIKQNKVEQWMLQRTSQLNQLNYFKLKLVIPGDTYITVGDVIEFTVPLVAGKSREDANKNSFHSGRFLITAVRHKINRDNYEMIVEATRDCVSQPYPESKNSLPLLNEFKKE